MHRGDAAQLFSWRVNIILLDDDAAAALPLYSDYKVLLDERETCH